LERANDDAIWQHARANGFTIVTQDSDFNERSVISGYPPKVIWLKCGNVPTGRILKILKDHHTDIVSFESEAEFGCLELG
jgi:predicted nuclease of predicted toxin-antitoxin system